MHIHQNIHCLSKTRVQVPVQVQAQVQAQPVYNPVQTAAGKNVVPVVSFAGKKNCLILLLTS